MRSVEIVGPQVGAQLRKQALLATLYSLAGMLVYLWFRFELIYGVAAVVAVFHDTLITVGAFSLFNKEISLTVIAAILTLIGYSMNDTIVVFDRIRENLRLTRREPLADVVNRSINQTLSRTVLTSGLTFLTVLSLVYLWRRGAAPLLLCPGDRHPDRHLFVDRGGGAYAGGLPGLARKARQSGRLPAAKGPRLRALNYFRTCMEFVIDEALTFFPAGLPEPKWGLNRSIGNKIVRFRCLKVITTFRTSEVGHV